MQISVVAFIDILGFRELASAKLNLDEQNRHLNSIYAVLGKTLPHIDERREPEFDDWLSDSSPAHDVRGFSDNYVVGFPINQDDDAEGELGTLFMRCGRFQFYMVQGGYFVRGGMAIGPHYMDDTTVFGSALIEAYTIESKDAVYPRIVLSDNLVRLVAHHMENYVKDTVSPQYAHLLQDADGAVFLDYLTAGLDDFEDDEPEQVRALVIHRDTVKRCLEEFQANTKVFDKYRWVAQYHNMFVSEKFPGQPDLLIPSSKFQNPPKRLSGKQTRPNRPSVDPG